MSPSDAAELSRTAGYIPAGYIIALFVSFIGGLLIYLKSNISDNNTIRATYQEKLNEVYEARVQESKAVLSGLRQYETSLNDVLKVMNSRNLMQDRMILVIERTSTAVDLMGIQNKEYVLDIQGNIKENREHISHLVRVVQELIVCCKDLRKLVKGGGDSP